MHSDVYHGVVCGISTLVVMCGVSNIIIFFQTPIIEPINVDAPAISDRGVVGSFAICIVCYNMPKRRKTT